MQWHKKDNNNYQSPKTNLKQKLLSSLCSIINDCHVLEYEWKFMQNLLKMLYKTYPQSDFHIMLSNGDLIYSR